MLIELFYIVVIMCCFCLRAARGSSRRWCPRRPVREPVGCGPITIIMFIITMICFTIIMFIIIITIIIIIIILCLGLLVADQWGQHQWGRCKKVMSLTDWRKKVRPGTFGKIKVG